MFYSIGRELADNVGDIGYVICSFLWLVGSFVCCVVVGRLVDVIGRLVTTAEGSALLTVERRLHVRCETWRTRPFQPDVRQKQ
jgi:hypothetical protein